MKYFLTGSSGFIGSHIKSHLLELGYEVFTVNHKHIIDQSPYFESYIGKLQPDHIIHCASAGNIYGKHTDDEILQSNIIGLHNLLKATVHINYKSFVNFSSLSVKLPVTTMYSASKLATEAICKSYVDSYGKPIVNVRPSTIFGPGEQKEHLIPKIIKSCYTGDPLSFVPEPVHDYLCIDDFVAAVIAVSNNAEKYKGQSIEVGSGIQHKNSEILKFIEKITRKKADVIISPSMRSYDTKEWKADTKTLMAMGWEQKTSVEQGLKLMVDDYKRQNKV